MPVSSKSVDIIIPVLNEAHVLEKSVETVRSFLGKDFPYVWRVVVVDNGSHDGTDKIAQQLTERYPNEVGFYRLDQRGRGRALRYAWQRSKADVCSYMDVDLSTDLAHLKDLVGAILEEGYDVSTGSRLMGASATKRSFKREAISRAYNLCIKLYLGTRFSDAQCGFKAVSRAFIDRVLPQIEDQGWFFDTELMVLAEKQGYRIKDIPVRWDEDSDSRVNIVQTATDDIKGLMRVKRYLSKEMGQATAKAAVAVKPPTDSN